MLRAAPWSKAGFFLGAGVVAASAMPSFAETVTLACDPSPPFSTDGMAIRFEGNDKGALTITGSFGEMRLPAVREARRTTDEDGEQRAVTGIRAYGPASVTMPEKTAIETCVKQRLTPGQMTDPDIVFTTVVGCAGAAPEAAGPVPVDATAEIALTPDVYVDLTRTYAQPTDLVIGRIAVEASPNCRIEK